MTNPIDIHFVYHFEGEWIAMYINGSLALQGRGLDERDVANRILDTLHLPISGRIEADAPKTDYRFPSNLRDVVRVPTTFQDNR